MLDDAVLRFTSLASTVGASLAVRPRRTRSKSVESSCRAILSAFWLEIEYDSEVNNSSCGFN